MIKLKTKRILSGLLAALIILTSQNFYLDKEYSYAAEIDEFTIEDGTITSYKGSNVEISIPERINGIEVRAIGEGVFEDKGLTKVTLPESLESIGNRAFANNKIKNIYIPESVTSIGKEAFLNADNNKRGSQLKVTGMKGVTTLEESSFAGMKDLEMEIPEVVNLSKSVFMPQFRGSYGTSGNYARLYTEDYLNKHHLESEEGVYLIDPATVRTVIMDANTKIPLKAPQEYYGNAFDQKTTNNKDDFYKIKANETLELKVANDKIIGYLTPKEGKQIGQIETPIHDLEFYFEPILISAPEQVTENATSIEGKTYPQATVKLEASTDGRSFVEVDEVSADASGKYSFSKLTLAALESEKTDESIEKLATKEEGLETLTEKNASENKPYHTVNGKPITKYKIQAFFNDAQKEGKSAIVYTTVGAEYKAGIKEIIQPDEITVKQGTTIKTKGKDAILPQTVKAKLTDDSEVDVKVSYWQGRVDTNKIGIQSYAGGLEYNSYYDDYDGETKVYVKIKVEADEAYYETDNEALISAISYAKSKLKSVPVSVDGKEIEKNIKWTTKTEYQKLEKEIKKAETKKNSHRYNQNQINELTEKLYEAVGEFEKKLSFGLKEIKEKGVEVKLLVRMKDGTNRGLEDVEVYLEDYSNKTIQVRSSKKEIKDKAIHFTFTGVNPATYIIKANDPYICLNSAGQRKREYLYIGDLGIDEQKIEVEKGLKLTYENGDHGKIIGTNVFYLLKGEHFEDFRPSEVKAEAGWFFKGWSLDGTTEIDLHRDIEEDTVLTALYSEESHGLINENTEVGNGWYMKHFEFDEDIYGNVQLKGFSKLGKERNQKFYNVTLPSVNYEGQPVTVVAPEAFDHTKGMTITNVEIPQGYERIYSHAFYENEIVTVTFPKSMKLIGASAFLRNKIKEVHLNEGLEEIVDGAFAENEIYAVNIPASVKKIRATAFADNKLDEVIFDFKNGVLQEIGKRAFYNNQLQYVIIPKTVSKIEFDAFEKNTGLTQYGGKVGVVIDDGKTNPHNLATTTYHVINPQINIDENTKTEKLNLYDAVIKLSLKRNALFASEDATSVPTDEKYISFEEMKTVEDAIYAGLYAFYDTSTGAVPIMYALGNEERYSIAYANEMLAKANLICDAAKRGEGAKTPKNRVNLQLGIPFIENKGDIRDHHEYVLVDKDNPNSRKYRFENIVDVVPNTAWFNYKVPTGKYILEAPVGMVFTKAVDQGGKLVEVKDLLEITAPQENDPIHGGLDTAAAQVGAIIIYDLMNTLGSQDKGESADKLYETVPKNTPAQNIPKVRAVEKGKKFAGWSFDGKTVVELKDLKIKSNTILKAVYIDGNESVLPSLDYRKISEKMALAKNLIHSTLISKDGSDVKESDTWVTKEIKLEFEAFLQEIEAQKKSATSQADLDNLVKQLEEKTKVFKNAIKKGMNHSDKSKLQTKYKQAQELLEKTKISTKEESKKLEKNQFWVTLEAHQQLYKCLVEVNWVLLDSRASEEMVSNISQKLDLEVEQFKKARQQVKKEEPSPETPGSSGSSDSSGGGSGSSGGGGGGGMIVIPKTDDKKEPPKVDDKEKIRALDLVDLMTKEAATEKVANLKDVKKITWSKEAVIKVTQKGMMSGDTKGNFMPKKKVTRAEVAQVIANILGEKESLAKVSDVGKRKWYAKAVQSVLAHEIFTLDLQGRFRPEDNISRAELFTVIARLKQIKALDSQKAQEVLASYKDSKEVPSWAVGHVAALVEKGIVSGSNHKLSPKDMLTREEMAVIFAKIVN